ncbi:cytochrome P450 [Mycena metata]|uniref:Cytochrome P450 n=1 Tax=Mycena metata TaxID=1033252 RepID=A0AAD7J2H8_9AGAR|nr:cytochrome P450 [Mycena metata]
MHRLFKGQGPECAICFLSPPTTSTPVLYALLTPPSTMAPSLLSLALVLALPALILFLVFRAIHLLFFHPLSSIPGPWYAAVSSLWITSHVLRLEQCKTIHALFEAYGPVVRIAPNKVVFCDLGAMKSVYSTWKFDKSDYYKSLLTNDNDHAMTTLPHAQHSIRRKAYASHYTPSNLAKLQPEIGDATGQMIDTLHGLPAHTPLDTLSLFRHLALDIIVSSSYGFSLGAIRKWALEAEEGLTVAIGDFPKRGILRSAVPTWAWRLVEKIPHSRVRLLCDSDKIMAEFVSTRVYEMRAQLNAGKAPAAPVPAPTVVAPTPSHFLSAFPSFSRSSSRASSPAPSCSSEDSSFSEDTEKSYMLPRLLAYKYPNGETMPESHVISECMGHMVAGTDTTSISLSYFLWELTRRHDILRKLQNEIDAVMPDPSAVPDIKILNGMEYLNAFIKEGLRLYGAAPSLLERVVPVSTSKNFAGAEGFDLMGYALPPGTIVSTQAWSMHRDAAVFPSPETFLPERWLPSYAAGSKEDGGEASEAEAARLARMASHMMPFGTGSRICGGVNLAHIIMRVVLVAVLRNFEIEAAPGTDEKSMDMRDSFVMFPAAMECKLIFHPRVPAA